MKTNRLLVILSFLAVFAGTLKSQDANGSNLNLSLFDGTNFSYSIDDAQSSPFADEFDITGISGGRHYLKVMAETNRMKKTPDILFCRLCGYPRGLQPVCCH